jgi:hypothetical protein
VKGDEKESPGVGEKNLEKSGVTKNLLEKI